MEHKLYAAAAAKSLQSCPTLCDPIDGSPPGSTAPGILQARTLEWGAITFSNKLCKSDLFYGNSLVVCWLALGAFLQGTARKKKNDPFEKDSLNM